MHSIEMTDQQRKAERFRALHIPGKPLVLFNIWDAGGAKAVAAAGAKAIATSSWSLGNANGFADGEQMQRAFVIDNLRRIAASTDLPVTVDLEAGYGSSPDEVAETIRLAIEAGAVGCNFEDSFPADGTLRAISEQVDRIRAARRAADVTGIAFFINARTDVFFQAPAEKHDNAMVTQAIERARAYAEAGAVGIFMPGLVDIALIARAAKESPLPLNVMVGDSTPPIAELSKSGVARVSYGPEPYFIAMKALEEAASSAIR